MTNLAFNNTKSVTFVEGTAIDNQNQEQKDTYQITFSINKDVLGHILSLDLDYIEKIFYIKAAINSNIKTGFPLVQHSQVAMVKQIGSCEWKVNKIQNKLIDIGYLDRKNMDLK